MFEYANVKNSISGMAYMHIDKASHVKHWIINPGSLAKRNQCIHLYGAWYDFYKPFTFRDILVRCIFENLRDSEVSTAKNVKQ